MRNAVLIIEGFFKMARVISIHTYDELEKRRAKRERSVPSVVCERKNELNLSIERRSVIMKYVDLRLT